MVVTGRFADLNVRDRCGSIADRRGIFLSFSMMLLHSAGFPSGMLQESFRCLAWHGWLTWMLELPVEGGHAGAILRQGRIATPMIKLPDGLVQIHSRHKPQAHAQAYTFR